MSPDNPKGTRSNRSFMNLRYIRTRTRTRNLFRHKCMPIHLGHSDGHNVFLNSRILQWGNFCELLFYMSIDLTTSCCLWRIQGRIQEFILGGAKPRSPIERWGRSPNRGREAPEYRGRSPSRGREAPENWGRSPNRGRSPRKIGGRVWGGGSVSPSPENFWKIKLETIHFGAYLKQLFEMTNEMV